MYIPVYMYIINWPEVLQVLPVSETGQLQALEAPSLSALSLDNCELQCLC